MSFTAGNSEEQSVKVQSLRDIDQTSQELSTLIEIYDNGSKTEQILHQISQMANTLKDLIGTYNKHKELEWMKERQIKGSLIDREKAAAIFDMIKKSFYGSNPEQTDVFYEIFSEIDRKVVDDELNNFICFYILENLDYKIGTNIWKFTSWYDPQKRQNIPRFKIYTQTFNIYSKINEIRLNNCRVIEFDVENPYQKIATVIIKIQKDAIRARQLNIETNFLMLTGEQKAYTKKLTYSLHPPNQVDIQIEN